MVFILQLSVSFICSTRNSSQGRVFSDLQISLWDKVSLQLAVASHESTVHIECCSSDPTGLCTGQKIHSIAILCISRIEFGSEMNETYATSSPVPSRANG